MDVRTLALILVTSLTLAACERSEAPQPAPGPTAAAPADSAEPRPAKKAASFVNRVWSVAESKQVEPGALRVFLSDGTLVMTSPNSKPAFGQWRSEDGQLTITEEGRDYPTDILELGEDAFRIRMHSPGEPVEILFAPAPQVAPDAVEKARALPPPRRPQPQAARRQTSRQSHPRPSTCWEPPGASRASGTASSRPARSRPWNSRRKAARAATDPATASTAS